MQNVAFIIWATVILSCFNDCRCKTTLCFKQYSFKILAIDYPLLKYKSTMVHCFLYSALLLLFLLTKRENDKKLKIKWKHWHLSTFHFIAFDWIFLLSNIHRPLFTCSRQIHVLAPYIAPDDIVFRFIFDSIYLIYLICISEYIMRLREFRADCSLNIFSSNLRTQT